MGSHLSLTTLMEARDLSAAGLAARLRDMAHDVSDRTVQRWAARTTPMQAADVDAVARLLALTEHDARRLLAWAAYTEGA